MPRGAVRSEESRIAILSAAARLIDRVGYEAVTIEGIAHEAGVGKQTIYRWYRSKGAIITEALAERLLLTHDIHIASGGDLRSDLSEWLERVLEYIHTARNAELISSIVTAAITDPEALTRLTERLGSSDVSMRARLEAARDAGQLGADVDLALLEELMTSYLVARAITRKAFRAGEGDALADILIGTR